MDLLQKARDYEEENRIPQEERPAFHVTPPVGWINDPNGFSFYQGKVHLFYQYHPYSTAWGPMHWGHQTSKDFIRWQECAAALAPDEAYDKEGCFSGSAIETEQGHVLVYTGVVKNDDGSGVRQNQCIAVGDGKNYKKSAKCPVITGDMLPEGFSRSDFRDPKIWKDGNVYYLVAGNLDGDGNGQIVLFSSENLYQWKYEGVLAHSEGTIGRMWECPDFFELDGRHILICSPQDMEAQGYEFHSGNNAVYFLGDYEKGSKTFSRGNPVSLDYGLDFYAPQTTVLPDGRRIMIAWMTSWDALFIPEGQKWQGMMTLPRELRVEHGKLMQQPVRELKNYRKNKIFYKNEILEGEKCYNGIRGRMIDFTLTIHAGEFHEFTVDVAKSEEYHTRISIDKDKNIMEIDRTYSGVRRDVACIRRVKLPDCEAGVKLRFIMDRNSVELFVNDGEMAVSTVIYTPLDAEEISLCCDGRAVIDLEKYEIEL